MNNCLTTRCRTIYSVYSSRWIYTVVCVLLDNNNVVFCSLFSRVTAQRHTVESILMCLFYACGVMLIWRPGRISDYLGRPCIHCKVLWGESRTMVGGMNMKSSFMYIGLRMVSPTVWCLECSVFPNPPSTGLFIGWHSLFGTIYIVPSAFQSLLTWTLWAMDLPILLGHQSWTKPLVHCKN